MSTKNKIDIMQFLPYFPPHKGGLETVAEEIGTHWIHNDLGVCINIVTHFDQESEFQKNENLEFEGNIIGYKKNGVENLVVPSFEVINNFPVYKIWSREYKIIKRYLRSRFKDKKNSCRIITHTRFFLTSLIGGSFARKNNMKWIHIEHGSDYVKLSSKLKSNIAYFYDRIIGKWIFKKTDIILAISNACKTFIQNEFVKREVSIFYRGINLETGKPEKKGDIKIVFIGRLVKLKGVEDLINAYKISNTKNELVIIGDGEEKEYLEKISGDHKVSFLGFKDKDYVLDFLSKNKCILVNPSYQEGLPTTVIEGLITGNVVIASNVGGTKEISDKNDLVLFNAGDIFELQKKILEVLESYEKLVGRSGIEVEERFSWNKNIFKLLAFVK